MLPQISFDKMIKDLDLENILIKVYMDKLNLNKNEAEEIVSGILKGSIDNIDNIMLKLSLEAAEKNN